MPSLLRMPYVQHCLVFWSGKGLGHPPIDLTVAYRSKNVMHKSMRLFIILMLVLLYGCSFTHRELTPEDIAATNARINVVKDEVVKPIYWLVKESCDYHLKNDEWPNTTGQTIDGGLIESVSWEPDAYNAYNLKVKLRYFSSLVNIKVENLLTEKTRYSVHISSENQKTTYKFNTEFDCSGPTLTNAELSHLASWYEPMIKVNDHNKNKTKSHASKGVGEVAIITSICLLLKLEPYQCTF